MTEKKRSKKSRARGSHTHGSGSKKKKRGAGNKGGRGNANSKKLSDKGFTPPHPKKDKNTINLEELNTHLKHWKKQDKIEKENGKYTIEADKLGYDKILGSGNINSELKIKAKSFSKKAKEKIEEAGGEAIEI